MDEDLIRRTKSLCPVCLNDVDAEIKEIDGNIYLLKKCIKHGHFKVLLSRAAKFYRKLDEYYFNIMGKENNIFEYEIWLTMRCNMDCPICHLGHSRCENKLIEPSRSDFLEFLKKNRAPFFVFSGGEPTCRDDLIEVIRIFKKAKRGVTIHTNGKKLINISYLIELKKSGLDRINLQFDGFSKRVYYIFRGEDLLETKLEVLNNLKKIDMPTDLNITIAKNINDKDIKDIFNFGVRHSFINSINFFTLCYLGQVRDWPIENYIMPDEVADMLVEVSDGKITKKNIFLFQKLHLAVKSFLKQRYCLYNQLYIVIRNKDSFEAIDKYIDLERAEFLLD
ncbi:MAG: radical SAM protein, partial [Candidatus Omnitrophica bacterium]|nr:radical SAM protein [Candidatus Omnitrophota bacterium]